MQSEAGTSEGKFALGLAATTAVTFASFLVRVQRANAAPKWQSKDGSPEVAVQRGQSSGGS